VKEKDSIIKWINKKRREQNRMAQKAKVKSRRRR